MLILTRRPGEAIIIGGIEPHEPVVTLEILAVHAERRAVTVKADNMKRMWTHRTGDGFFLTEQVYVNFLSVRGNQAKLGFNAPASVPINRKEIYRRLVAERQKGAA